MISAELSHAIGAKDVKTLRDVYCQSDAISAAQLLPDTLVIA